VLEVGAGIGWQAQALQNRGYDLSAIDLPLSNSTGNRIWPVIDYDGHHIPFEENTFDVVYSSNVLEHISRVCEFQKEIHRVLKPDGCVIHFLPSSSWRIWTSITHLLKWWTIPKSHGEHAGNSLTEVFCLSRRWWTGMFHETGWTVVSQHSNRLFYTGYSIMDSRLPLRTRHKLSYILGGSCNIFVLRKKSETEST